MRSIYVLNEYGVSMTILKKLFDLKISYLDLEVFKEQILKENKIIKDQITVIMSALEQSKKTTNQNYISELQLYGLSRNYTLYLIENNITLQDIINNTEEEFCTKFSVKRKLYNEATSAYQKLVENNFNIKKVDDYSIYLLEILKEEAQLQSITYEELLAKLKELTYPLEELDKDLAHLSNKAKIIIVDNKLTYNSPSILDFVQTLDEKKQYILHSRYEGNTLQEIALNLSITRERIRQIIETIYSKMPIVKEDKYQYIYKKYELSEKEFTTIFEEPKSTYYYLFDKYEKGHYDFLDIENEPFVDEEMLKRIKSLKNIICINDTYIECDRTGITKYYMKNYLTGEITIPELLKRMNNYLAQEFSKYNIEPYDSEHNIETLLSRKNWCVFGRNKKVRYYEMNLLSENDLTNLENILDVEYGLYSSLYFFENNKDLMSELDIRNEQELHNILRNLISNPKVSYLRMPNILIGYTDKKDFFLDKIFELSPISQQDFLNIMRTQYGHREDTLLSYLNLEFGDYLTNNEIISKNIELKESEMNLLKTHLTKTIYSKNEFKDILLSLNLENTNQFLTNINLKKIDYKISGKYILKRSCQNLEQAIYNGILKGEITHSFLNISSTSWATIYKMEKEYKVIEINNKYYPFENIYNTGITRTDIDVLLDLVTSKFSRNNIYFTVKNIRDELSCNLLETKPITDSVISSLVKLLPNFKKVQWHGNVIFCYSPTENVSRTLFLKSVIEKYNCHDVKELKKILKEDYAVEVNEDQIINIIYQIGIGNIKNNLTNSLTI